METFIHADIFFFITTIAVVVFAILLCVAMFYLIQILANFRAISRILRSGAENVEENISEAARNLAKNPLVKMFFSRKTKHKNKAK